MTKSIAYSSFILIPLLFVGYSWCTTFRVRQPNANIMQESPQNPGIGNINVISDEEYAIYSLLIKGESSKTLKIFIANKTVKGLVKPYSTFDEVFNAIKVVTKFNIPKDALDDYSSKNQGVSEVLDKFALANEHKIGNDEDFTNGQYGVTFSFSRVGFTQKRDIALVYYQFYSGPKTAGGFYVILSKVNGMWNEAGKFTPWIS